MTQIHMIGASLGLAMGAAASNAGLVSRLMSLLSPNQVDQLVKSTIGLNDLPTDLQERTRLIYARGYNQEFTVATVFAVLALVSTAMLIERNPRKLEPSSDASSLNR